MLKKIILIVLSVVIVITGITVYYFNSLTVSEDLIKECEEELMQNNFREVSLTLSNGEVIEAVRAEFMGEDTKLVNGDKVLSCGTDSPIISLCQDGEYIYYSFYRDSWQNFVYRTDKDFSVNELYCITPVNFSSYIVVVDGVIYGRYVTGSDEGTHLSVYNLAKYDAEANQLNIIAHETPGFDVKLFKDGLLYLVGYTENEIYTFDIENEVMEKLPFKLYDIGRYQYNSEKIELLSDNIIKVYSFRDDKNVYFKEEPVIYIFNTKTGRRCKV
ncbi:MAG: hypothetical protein IJZ88_06100 [Clostridia bacterium]|nr:hypothetical protein [Clostridia bacterium]